MIIAKIDVNHEKRTSELKLEISGDVKTLAADACVLIEKVRDAIKEKNKMCADVFEALVKGAISSGFAFADEEERDEILERTKKEAEEIKNLEQNEDAFPSSEILRVIDEEAMK